MKFTRPRQVITTSTGPGTTEKTVTYPEITDLHFTDTSAADGSTIELPTAWNWESTFEINLNQHNHFWVTCHVEDLGVFNRIYVILEFQHPDNPDIWIASNKYVPRNVVAWWWNAWQLAAVGDYVLRTRDEFAHYNRVRVRFMGLAPKLPPMGTTLDMRAYWFYGGLPTGGRP